jgi:O-antigen/teichoic acid export membrane protein
MIDLVMLATSLVAGSVELATLYVCFRYLALAGYGTRTIYNLFLPKIVKFSNVNDIFGLQRKIFLANGASLIYSATVLCVFALIGKWLVSLFSLEGDMAVMLLVGVSATMSVQSIFGPAALILATKQRHTVVMLVSLVGLACGLAFIWIMYSSIGIISAVIAYFGANAFISSYLWYYLKQNTGIDSSIFCGIPVPKPLNA